MAKKGKTSRVNRDTRHGPTNRSETRGQVRVMEWTSVSDYYHPALSIICVPQIPIHCYRQLSIGTHGAESHLISIPSFADGKIKKTLLSRQNPPPASFEKTQVREIELLDSKLLDSKLLDSKLLERRPCDARGPRDEVVRRGSRHQGARRQRGRTDTVSRSRMSFPSADCARSSARNQEATCRGWVKIPFRSVRERESGLGKCFAHPTKRLGFRQ